jgi:hypothetical protein
MKRPLNDTPKKRLLEACGGLQALAAFVADNANGEKPPTYLTFLLNFFNELRRKAAVGK